MSDSLLQELNPAQQEAVSAAPGHLTILAGAGSGKTRVLVHRIAWLIQQGHASPYQILAVTFTNKAAREMQERLTHLLGMQQPGLWVGTFHGLSHRWLRMHWQEAGLSENFQIMDSDDQHRLIRRILKNNELDEKKWPPKQIQWSINGHKEQGRRADDVGTDGSHHGDVMLNLYKQYEEICARSGLIDFTELLLRTVELLRKNKEIREHYQQRFRFILIDEFQDTNSLQYQWLQLLHGFDNHCMAVGDDDQSIYSWRGAQSANLQRFQDEFSPNLLIRLEQNYRSTEVILSAANQVISNNEQRLGKELWTDRNGGELISIYNAFNERDEANYIVSEIRQRQRQGMAFDKFAIVYRANALSRVLEEALLSSGVPYRVYGGQRFFERAEIKDALSYLRLITNPEDDAALERVINTPTRGIGQTTLNLCRQQARDENCSLWRAIHTLIVEEKLSARACNAIQVFINLIEDLQHDTRGLSLHEQTQHIFDASGLMLHFRKDRSEKGLSRVENLEELITATREFTPEPHPDQNNTVEMTPLTEFLSAVALETDRSSDEGQQEAVSLMTLHAAKGLEFDIVFICGCEEGLFPHQMCLEEEKGLEEERRLCYVGMTRARQKLYLTLAECRHQYGREQFNKPSRFIREIPHELCDIVRTSNQSYNRSASSNYKSRSHATSTASSTASNNKSKKEFSKSIENDSFADIMQPDFPMQVGQRVRHPSFGAGTLVAGEGQGSQARVQIRFDTGGTKWLVLRFAQLSAE